MENIIFGIPCIIICIIGYYYSWIFFLQKKYLTALGLLMFCGFILRFYVSADFYLHDWDERFHALVAKNLIKHPLVPTLYDNPILPYDYKSWTCNHIWVHKQPLPLWVMALSMRIFGINEIAFRLPSVLFTTLGIWLTFEIGKYLFNNKIGFIAAFLYSINGFIIELSGGRVPTDHFDVFFLFFIELAVFFTIRFSQKKLFFYNILCGTSIGAAILCKWLPALIVLPIWLLLVINSKKFTRKELVFNLWILCLMIFVIAVPWQIYIHVNFTEEARWESSYNVNHIFEPLREHEDPFYYHFNKLRMIYGELIYIPFIWFTWKTLKKWKNLKRLTLFIWILIPYIFFTFVKTRMQGYTLFTAPAIFIVTAVFWQYLFIYRHTFRYKKIIYLILFLILALPVRYSIERIKPFRKRERNPGYIKEIKHLNNIYKSDKTIFFNINLPIEMMFYTNYSAYHNIPEIKTINKLIKEGYKVVINDKGNLHDEIKNIKDIELIKLKEK